MNNLTKTLRNHEIKSQTSSIKKGKKMKNNQTNINVIEMREDLPYEKLEREEKLKKEKEKETMDRERREAEAKAEEASLEHSEDVDTPSDGGLFANAKNGIDALKKLKEN